MGRLHFTSHDYFNITAMSGHLTQQSMKELELLIVSSFI